MKKASTILATIYIFIGAVGVIVGTIYTIMYMGYLTANLTANSVGTDTGVSSGFYVLCMSLFLLATIYSGIAMVTALLTRKVIKDNVLDKIKPFGILSIIFLNVVGGIFTLVYDKQVKDELERTAPKGKRKEASKE